jgi:hypothetical protein
MKFPQDKHGLKNGGDTDYQPRYIVEMTLKISPKLMNALLILGVVNKRNLCGKGMRESAGTDICLKNDQHFKSISIV